MKGTEELTQLFETYYERKIAWDHFVGPTYSALQTVGGTLPNAFGTPEIQNTNTVTKSQSEMT